MTRFCLALDTQSVSQAAKWVARSNNVFDTYKVGLEYFVANGWAGLKALSDAGAESLFLDLKLHDIPRTVERTILAMEGRGVDFVTIHTGGGREMLRSSQRAAEAVGIRLFGVTVLTSLSDEDMMLIGLQSSTSDAVLHRCQLAADCHLFGVVSSSKEVQQIKQRFDSKLYCVTPGIRFPWDETGDQKRIMTPQKAIEQGADMLVIGRSYTRSPQPERIEETLKELQQ